MSLEKAITSSSSLKRNSGASGPKVSSRATAALDGTSTRMVGSKKVPPRLWGLPPETTRAPLDTASSMCSCTLATALASISGPVVMPSSRPLPIFRRATAAFSLSTKASYTPSCT
ncbi:hypothetical protein D3C85_1564660 [compost metagenome]